MTPLNIATAIIAAAWTLSTFAWQIADWRRNG